MNFEAKFWIALSTGDVDLMENLLKDVEFLDAFKKDDYRMLREFHCDCICGISVVKVLFRCKEIDQKVVMNMMVEAEFCNALKTGDADLMENLLKDVEFLDAFKKDDYRMLRKFNCDYIHGPRVVKVLFRCKEIDQKVVRNMIFHEILDRASFVPEQLKLAKWCLKQKYVDLAANNYRAFLNVVEIHHTRMLNKMLEKIELTPNAMKNILLRMIEIPESDSAGRQFYRHDKIIDHLLGFEEAQNVLGSVLEEFEESDKFGRWGSVYEKYLEYYKGIEGRLERRREEYFKKVKRAI